MKRLLVYGGLALWLAACAAPGLRSEEDRPPLIVPPGALSRETLQPRWEPRAAVGNHSPYRVFGVEYRVLPSAEQFEERGIASWYGRKFHGRHLHIMQRLLSALFLEMRILTPVR